MNLSLKPDFSFISNSRVMKISKYLAHRLTPFIAFFLVLESVVRLSLSLYDGNNLEGAASEMPTAFMIGFLFDLSVFCYLAIPILFYAVCLPQKLQGSRTDKIGSTILFFIFAYILLFSAVGEWLFWEEFQTRYNFIAVDYLVYSREVIGNIRESYPLGLILSGMAAVTSLFTFAYYKYSDSFLPRTVSLPRRALEFATVIGLCFLSFFSMHSSYADISNNRYTNHIGRNGIYELFSAFRNNELDYDNFYMTKPVHEIEAFIEQKVGTKEDDANPLDRFIENNGDKKYNLVLITVESLGANFLKEFGNKDNITPNLDALIPNSLFFSNLYATGTRTVYGLSAITLAMPPVPGNSIVRRPHNENLFSLGHVLESQGYVSKFIYGGYGYFDNMNDFFGDNGYEIVDRNVMTKEEINFANIWGVADDDVYRRALKENDKAHAEGKPFFDMIMTTSNHRPYTFPEGKIDLPSKTSGRRGGVKFTDFAIDEFLKEAKKRPWFDNTIFVIVADHTAGSGGKAEVDPDMYHIPMWVYAPGIVKPGRIDYMASQIDVAPTILGMMGIDYESRFYGKDLMKEKPGRAFLSNYQALGYLTADGLVVLRPGKQAQFLTPDASGEYVPQKDVPQALLDETIGYYQSASKWKEWSRQ
jgi:phosphoglycerol transferase MdoB-like AlkP superfamily enzyme